MYYNTKDLQHIHHHDNLYSKNDENGLKMNILRSKQYKLISQHNILK